MQVSDIVARVRPKLSDPEGTYVTDEYVLGFVEDAYEEIYNELALAGTEFDDWRTELPNVQAGLPNLNSFMTAKGVLGALLVPKIIEWKLPGQDPTYYQRADGPLDYPRDTPNGTNALDSWAWKRSQILLSNYSINLDLRVWGEYTFTPLVDLSAQIEIARDIAPALVYRISLACAIERGNPGWITNYQSKSDDSFDAVKIKLVHDDQGLTERVRRMSRPAFGDQGPYVSQQP